MEIKKLQRFEKAEAMALVWRVFSQFEAPDYTQEGIDRFHDFIHSEEVLNE